MAVKKEDTPKFELIKFYGNWADEMDVHSFTVKPLGFLEELVTLSEEYLKEAEEIELHVGSNEIIYFSKENPDHPYRSTVKSTFQAEEISSEDRETLVKLFNLKDAFVFNIDVFGRLAENLLSGLSLKDEEILKSYPLIHKELFEE